MQLSGFMATHLGRLDYSPMEDALDATTLGKQQAAIELTIELKRHPILQKRVMRFINDFKNGLIELDDISDDTYRDRVALLWRNDFLKRVSFHEEMDSFIENILVTEFREFMRRSHLKRIE